MAVYSDNFDDNSIDAAFWDEWSADTNTSVDEQNNQLEVTTSSGSDDVAGLVTKDTYDFTAPAYCEYDPISVGGDGHFLFLMPTKVSTTDPYFESNWYRLGFVGGTWYFQRKVSGSATTLGSGGGVANTDDVKLEFPSSGDEIRAILGGVEKDSDATYGLATRDLYALICAIVDTGETVSFDDFAISTATAGSTEVNCTVGAITITGNAASISAGKTISCTVGEIAIIGNAAAISAGTTISCTAGVITISGISASISAGNTISATTGTVTIAGHQAQIDTGGATTIECSVGPVAITGLQSSISAGSTIACTVGAITITGNAASISAGKTISCTVGEIAITGYQSDIVSTTLIECTTGTLIIVSYQATIATAEQAAGRVSISISTAGPGLSISGKRPGLSI